MISQRLERALLARLSAFLVASAVAFFTTSPALAEIRLVQTAASTAPVLIVRNDAGGVIITRATEIERLRAAGTRVEIGGQVCLSSCTMYLGLQNTCISRKTTFGFHAPISLGRPFTAQEFDGYSKMIARHYPQSLRTWYMRDARYITSGYASLKGAELIRLGIAECTRRS